MSTEKEPTQPMQPIVDGRFKENKIVSYLLDNGGIDLNHLACVDFPQEDKEQFAQLIGYSLNGYQELSYVSNDSYDKAVESLDPELTPEQAEIKALKSTLEIIRTHLRDAAAEAFRIHPDDLYG